MHGDDYLSAGDPEALDRLEAELKSQHEIKTQRVGHGPKCSAEDQILNRVTDDGFELEGAPRHAELVVEQLGLYIEPPARE